MSAPLSPNGFVSTYVLFPLGDKRFALPATTVRELAKQDELQTFPHTTPLLTGVVLRREQIVPVCDLAPVLVGAEAPERKFFLIVSSGESRSPMAVPVTGECELTEAEQLPITGKLPPYICGLLSLKDEIVEVLDLPSALLSEVRA